jgi:hypothetical protein
MLSAEKLTKKELQKFGKSAFRLHEVSQSSNGTIYHVYIEDEEVAKKMEQSVKKRLLYEKEYKREFRDSINAKRRMRYANDDEFRQKERERVRKATKTWSEKTEQEKERKRIWQREYMRKRYKSDPEFREKQKERVRKSSTGFMRFGGYKSVNNKKKVKK